MEIASNEEFERVGGKVSGEGFELLGDELDHRLDAAAGERQAGAGERGLQVVQEPVGAELGAGPAELFFFDAAQVAGDGEEQEARRVVVGRAARSRAASREEKKKLSTAGGTTTKLPRARSKVRSETGSMVCT